MSDPTSGPPARPHGDERDHHGLDHAPAPARIPRWLDTGASFGWRFLLVAASLYVLAFVLQRLLVVVLPLVLAAMLATVLAPPANWMRRHRVRPALATWIVFLAASAVFAALCLWLVPTVRDQSGPIGHSAGHGVNQVKHWLVTGPLKLRRKQVDHDVTQLGRDIRAHATGLAWQGATIALEVAAGLLLTLVTAFFFVKDGARLARSAMQLFGQRRADELPALGALLWRTLTAYVRGTTINGVVNGVLIGAGLYIIGVPLVLPLAVLTFFGAYFPIVGSFVSGALAALVALAAIGPVAALVVIGLTLVIHNVEAYLVGPFVLGHAVELHPLVVLLVIAAGGVVAGIVGAFLAVPLTALITATIRFYRQMEPELVVVPPDG